MIDSDFLSAPKNGLHETFWPNGRPRYRGNFQDERAVGQHLRFFENGLLAQVCWYDEQGRPRGTTLNFDRDGSKVNEEINDDGERRAGTFVANFYDSSGDIFMKTEYEEYSLIDSWQRDPSDPESDAMINDLVAKAIEDLEKSLDPNDDDEGEDGD